MSEEEIVLEIADGVATLSLNRPHNLNAISESLARSLRAAIDAAEAAGSVRALLLKGVGRAFCAGGDIAIFGDAERHSVVADRTMAEFHPAILRLTTLSLPTVAAVHGAVAGAGIGLMLACDFAIAADDTRFTLAYSKIGATTDGGASWFLPRCLGARKAKELAMLSEQFDASTALDLGLVTRVVAAAELEAAARQLAMRLAAGPTGAFVGIKRLIDSACGHDLARHLEAERSAFVEIADGDDFREGLKAFREKRTPVFGGRRSGAIAEEA